MHRTLSSRELFDALQAVGRTLGQRFTFERAERYSFPLADGWTIRVSPYSAGRLRIDSCHRGHIDGSVWCSASDRGRLEQAVRTFEQRILASA